MDREDRRLVPRVSVELECRWRRVGDARPPTLALLFDLSPRGARIGGWYPLTLVVGERIEMSLDGSTMWRAEVRSDVGDGEFGVHFTDISAAVKRHIIDTLGGVLAGTDGWARRPPNGT